MKTEQPNGAWDLVPLDQIQINPDNPREMDPGKFEDLKRSIQEFPQMLEARRIVVDENGIILGGNHRYLACKELGFETVPIIRVTGWSEKRKKEFLVKDNITLGDFTLIEWDDVEQEELIDWGMDITPDPEILEKKVITDEEFEKEAAKLNDDHAANPIVPEFHEKYSFFLILTKNEIDEQWVRNTFDLTQKHDSHKGTDPRLSNFIPIEKLQEKCSPK